MRDAYDLDLSSIRNKVDLECTCTGVAVAAIAKGKREWVGGAFKGSRVQVEEAVAASSSTKFTIIDLCPSCWWS